MKDSRTGVRMASECAKISLNLVGICQKRLAGRNRKRAEGDS